jgi:hypothetical protein
MLAATHVCPFKRNYRVFKNCLHGAKVFLVHFRALLCGRGTGKTRLTDTLPKVAPTRDSDRGSTPTSARGRRSWLPAFALRETLKICAVAALDAGSF